MKVVACIRISQWRCGLSQLQAFFWWDCMAGTSARGLAFYDRRPELYLAGRYPACGRAQELPQSLHARSGDLSASARTECGLELRGANGDRWSCWRLRWGNDIASREPYSCSLHRYRDWFCRVSLLLLEVVRPGRGADRRRIDGRAGLGDQRAGARFSIPIWDK